MSFCFVKCVFDTPILQVQPAGQLGVKRAPPPAFSTAMHLSS
jgi:hypothetical protein